MKKLLIALSLVSLIGCGPDKSSLAFEVYITEKVGMLSDKLATPERSLKHNIELVKDRWGRPFKIISKAGFMSGDAEFTNHEEVEEVSEFNENGVHCAVACHLPK